MFNPWVLLAVILLIVGAGFSGYRHGVKTTEATYKAAIAEQKAEAAKILAQETDKVRAIEAKHAEINLKLEAANGQHKQAIKNAVAKAKLDAFAAGGLRDPGRRPSCSCPSAENSASAVPASGTTEGRLSDELTQFLIGEAGRADQAASYGQDCQAWAKSVASP